MKLNKTLSSWSLALVAALLTLLTSCDTQRRTNYLQDMELAKTYGIKYDMGLTIQKGDKLSVIVTSIRNPELTIPFNARGAASVPTGDGMTITTTNASVSIPTGVNASPEPTAQVSYLVDPEGYIQFPVLGMVRVAGLTLDQASELIRTRLVAEKYLADAHVTTVFNNLRVYMLGAIGGGINNSYNNSYNNGRMGGVFHMDNAQTNVLEFIAQIGGLNEQANFERVNIIRKEANGYVMYRVNMLSNTMFESPAFILRQNDIVYAEYKYRRRDTEAQVFTTLGYISTAMSTVLSTIAFITYFRR